MGAWESINRSSLRDLDEAPRAQLMEQPKNLWLMTRLFKLGMYPRTQHRSRRDGRNAAFAQKLRCSLLALFRAGVRIRNPRQLATMLVPGLDDAIAGFSDGDIG